MLTIRPMTAADDFSAAAQVYVESWRHAYRDLLAQRYLDKLSPQAWLSMMKADPEANLIALEDERIIGTAYVTFARDEARQGYGEIVSLYLLPEAAGRGYGKRLWQACVEACRAQGLSGVCLWVFAGNESACGFYRRMGMQPTGRTRTEAMGGAQCTLMEYTLLL